ncbi:type I-C CRISPR-associated protein Cas7/Csd2 [Clostridium sp.]|uniref:type I-C CRISPR-associated protein Cas7/Csd2 n=1 Tax=Clostridium sp. TaxID=1506 RepID=UPI002609FA4A|nr:type I-C CRISPR-associated protein Cas7/Csd2 [Clostridium sp.]
MSNVIGKRYEFVLFFDVENGNPNGDPEAGNTPRIDPETGHGIVTDVCIKRKIRNYVELAKEDAQGYDIYVKDGAILNSQHQKAYDFIGVKNTTEKEKKELSKDKDLQKQLTKFMCDNFYDIRAFGAVMSLKVNCGVVRGPVQINFAKSIDPIFQQEVTILRMAAANEIDGRAREMGRKYIVPYGLYRVEGYISAELAKRVTGFTEDDLNLLWEALINMFEHDHSASRGKMAARKLIVFEHETSLGNAPSHILFEKVKVKNINSPARSIKDYEIIIDKDLINGVTIIEKL